jgi:hypothetical protein
MLRRSLVLSAVSSVLWAALALLPGRGQAWGVTGHAIVADIAERHLTPAALEQVHALLREEGWEHLDQVASWPDTIRKERPEASPWHYTDIPLTESTYLPARDCKNGDCAVEAIKRFTAILADRGLPAAKREEALKFLVHFVGDQQQPLHGAENEGDHGGGTVKVVYLGESGPADRPLDLHWVWDTKIIEHHLNVREGATTDPNLEARRGAAIAANDIDRKFDGHLPEADIADPAVWAQESHDAARAAVYPGVVAPGARPPASPVILGQAYQKKAWPVVEKRLELGGLRLANLLNKALGS